MNLGERLRSLRVRIGGRQSQEAQEAKREAIGEKAVEMAKSATSTIRIVAQARPDDALLEVLPRIIENAPRGIRVKAIVVVPKKGATDEATWKKMKEISEAAEKRNGDIRATSLLKEEVDEELKSLELELQGEPTSKKLSVFIKDPVDRALYRFRKIGIHNTGSFNIEGKEIPFVAIERIPMGFFDEIPCFESQLPIALKLLSQQEENIGSQPDSDIKSMQAVVGVARYSGTRSFSIDTLTKLVALKYNQMLNKTSGSSTS